MPDSAKSAVLHSTWRGQRVTRLLAGSARGVGLVGALDPDPTPVSTQDAASP